MFRNDEIRRKNVEIYRLSIAAIQICIFFYRERIFDVSLSFVHSDPFDWFFCRDSVL